ncbi:MAG: DUF4376 domain-containing protein [Xanthomonadaceae bacterium]|nr:DUF4376 domain-containing protein [Xanthomonadaceae bacterium]
MNFLEYAEGGRVLQGYHSCNAAPPASWGGTVIETVASHDPSQTMVVDGVPVDLGPPPTAHHVIDYVAQAWRLPGDLTELRIAQDAKWVEIRDERDRREREVFPYLGQWLQCDVISVLRMSGAKEAAAAALAAGVEFNETWTCADNTELPVTAHEVLGMLPALALWSSGLHAIGRDLRAQIEACETAAAVAAVSWPG